MDRGGPYLRKKNSRSLGEMAALGSKLFAIAFMFCNISLLNAQTGDGQLRSILKESVDEDISAQTLPDQAIQESTAESLGIDEKSAQLESSSKPPEREVQTGALAELSPGALSDQDNDISFNDGGGVEIGLNTQKRQIPFSLFLNGRVQIRYSYLKDQSIFENSTLSEFELERARLGARGYAYEKFLRYDITADFDSDGSSPGAASLITAITELRLDDALGIGWGNKSFLRAGYWRTNFGRQAAESSKRMQFVERSMVSTFFNLGSNTGVALRGELTALYKPARYEVALLNGFGTGSNRPRTGLDNQLGVSGRLYYDLVGSYTVGESDLRLSTAPAWRIGASLGATRRKRSGPDGAADEFDASPATLIVANPSSGDPVSFMDELTGRERQYDLALAGLENSFKYCGFSLHTEFFIRSIDNVVFEGQERFSDLSKGFYVQGGYFLTEYVEVALRHGSIYADGRGNGSPTRTAYANTSNETGVGLNFYFRGDDSKLQFDVFRYDGAALTSSALNIRAGDDGWMFRTQYQLSF